MKSAFSPRPVEIIVAAVFIGIFCSLGNWQLNRADEKRAIQEQIVDRSRGTPVDLRESLARDKETLAYQRVTVKGEYIDSGVIYVDNVMHDRRPGMNVVMPLRIMDSDKVILINRGWIAHGKDRQLLPSVGLPGGEVNIEGELRQPSRLPMMDATTAPLSQDQPNLWLYVDIERYGKEAGLQLLPFVILQTNSDGSSLIKEWPEFESKTAMHTGYAIQWFGLALVTLGIFLKVSVGRRDRKTAARTG